MRLRSAVALGVAIAALAQAGAGSDGERTLKRKHMSETTARAAAQLAEFEQKKNPQSLQAAADLLEGVDLDKEPDATKRLTLRRETLETWLKLIALIDKNLDPGFDPDDVPSVSVTPPPSAAGVAYPSGIAPADIPDPEVRRQYEGMRKQNQDKAQRYNLQDKLRRLDKKLTPKSERFVRLFYTTVTGDQRELSELVGNLIPNQDRAAALRRAAAPKP
jgi:hypothetical protein